MDSLDMARNVIFIVVTFLLSAHCATSNNIATNDGLQSQARLSGSPNHIATCSSAQYAQEYVGTKLNFSAAAPHLFHSASSLLQQLPNTVFPNGHTIAPVEIPPLTLFYHARRDAEVPSSPEWVAFDSEMSYGIMGGHRNVWMRTYQSTRPIRALYFDGESGNLQGLGQFDTQMLLLFGNVTGAANETRDDLELEYVRAEGLCKWLQDAGLRTDSKDGHDGSASPGFDGIVRMNAGFEMIWCDFESDALRLVSSINVTAPQLPAKEQSDDNAAQRDAGDDTPKLPDMPPGWKDELRREPFLRTRSWGWFDSASWHYGAFGARSTAGEMRARVLSCGILSYYSSNFAGQAQARAREECQRLNLTDNGLWMGPGADGERVEALLQLRRRRRFHHLEHASSSEAGAMKRDLEDTLRALLRRDGRCELADWTLITNEIVRRTSDVLRAQGSVLASPPKDWSRESAVRQWLDGVRGRSHLFLVNFLQYPETQDLSVWLPGSKLFNDTLRLCRSRYTLLLQDEKLRTSMPQESELARAVEEVFGTICLVQLETGFDIERGWREAYGDGQEAEPSTSSALCRLKHRARAWHDQLLQLVAWLGWENEHIGCKEVCAADERCYIPMWPITRPDKPSATIPKSHATRTLRRPWVHSDEEDLWEPKCVKEVCIEGLCDL